MAAPSASSLYLSGGVQTALYFLYEGWHWCFSREYHKKLFGPLFFPWWNCPLIKKVLSFIVKTDEILRIYIKKYMNEIIVTYRV